MSKGVIFGPPNGIRDGGGITFDEFGKLSFNYQLIAITERLDMTIFNELGEIERSPYSLLHLTLRAIDTMAGLSGSDSYVEFLFDIGLSLPGQRLLIYALDREIFHILDPDVHAYFCKYIFIEHSGSYSCYGNLFRVDPRWLADTLSLWFGKKKKQWKSGVVTFRENEAIKKYITMAKDGS